MREPLDLDDPRCSAIGTTRMLAPEFSNARVWLLRDVPKGGRAGPLYPRKAAASASPANWAGSRPLVDCGDFRESASKAGARQEALRLRRRE